MNRWYCNQYTKRTREQRIDDFMGSIDFPENPDECWNWNMGTGSMGYGSFKLDGKEWIASRLMWTIFYGDIPPGMFVCHKCDNPKCQNLRHFFLGTTQENTADKVSKGRCVHHQSDKSSNTKISWGMVREVRRIRLETGMMHKDIAKIFGLHKSHVGQIIRGEIWDESRLDSK